MLLDCRTPCSKKFTLVYVHRGLLLSFHGKMTALRATVRTSLTVLVALLELTCAHSIALRPPLRAATLRRCAAPVSAVSSARPNQRLVLVEDNDGMRTALQRYLSENGFNCESYAGGADALRAMANGRTPDLIITDVMMPNLDGLTLLQRVRADQRFCAVPVVLLTAKALKSDRIAGFKAGASAYVSKPFDPEVRLF